MTQRNEAWPRAARRRGEADLGRGEPFIQELALGRWTVERSLSLCRVWAGRGITIGLSQQRTQEPSKTSPTQDSARDPGFYN